MNAIILSGGVGSRLYPLTEKLPKPMLPLANRPVLDYVISQLVFYGFNRVTLTLAYKPEIIRAHALSYEGIECSFSLESSPLGTAGAVKLAKDSLDDTFLVVSGDGISDIDLRKMTEKHRSSKALVTMAVTTVKNPCAYGVVTLDGNDTVTGFIEKPKTAEYGNLVNTGVYIIEKSVLDLIPDAVAFDFSRDLFPSLVKAGKISAYLHSGYWCDIGDKKSYYEENFHLMEGGFYPFALGKTQNSTHAYGGIVGEGSIILGKVRDSVIGKSVRVASSARVFGCVVMDGATVTGEHYGEIIGEGFTERIIEEREKIVGNTAVIEQNLQKNPKIFPKITP